MKEEEGIKHIQLQRCNFIFFATAIFFSTADVNSPWILHGSRRAKRSKKEGQRSGTHQRYRTKENKGDRIQLNGVEVVIEKVTVEEKCKGCRGTERGS